MIKENDLKKINETIEILKTKRENNMKSKILLTLEDGTEGLVYHLGNNNKTIRFDFKI